MPIGTVELDERSYLLYADDAHRHDDFVTGRSRARELNKTHPRNNLNWEQYYRLAAHSYTEDNVRYYGHLLPVNPDDIKDGDKYEEPIVKKTGIQKLLEKVEQYSVGQRHTVRPPAEFFPPEKIDTEVPECLLNELGLDALAKYQGKLWDGEDALMAQFSGKFVGENNRRLVQLLALANLHASEKHVFNGSGDTSQARRYYEGLRKRILEDLKLHRKYTWGRGSSLAMDLDHAMKNLSVHFQGPIRKYSSQLLEFDFSIQPEEVLIPIGSEQEWKNVMSGLNVLTEDLWYSQRAPLKRFASLNSDCRAKVQRLARDTIAHNHLDPNDPQFVTEEALDRAFSQVASDKKEKVAAAVTTLVSYFEGRN